MANATFAKGNPYKFHVNNVVLIKTPDHENLGHNGGQGLWARWHVEKNGDNFKFKNVKTGKYMRIGPHGGVKWTVFKVHHQGDGKAKLESVEHKGKYVSIKKDGSINQGIGGPHCNLQFTRKD